MDGSTDLEDCRCVILCCFYLFGGLGILLYLFQLHFDFKMWTQRMAECVDIEVDVAKLDDSDATIHMFDLLNIHGCFCPEAALKGCEEFCFHFQTSTSGCRSRRVVFSVSIGWNGMTVDHMVL